MYGRTLDHTTASMNIEHIYKHRTYPVGRASERTYIVHRIT